MGKSNIPTEMEVALSYKLLTLLYFPSLTLLTLLTLYKQLWSKKGILPICIMAILLNGLLSKKAGGMDGWIGYPLDCNDYQTTCGANNRQEGFVRAYSYLIFVNFGTLPHNLGRSNIRQKVHKGAGAFHLAGQSKEG